MIEVHCHGALFAPQLIIRLKSVKKLRYNDVYIIYQIFMKM